MQDAIADSRVRRALRRADIHLTVGDREAALSSFAEALAVRPDHTPTLLQVAQLHFDAGRHTPGREAVLKALGGHIESPLVARQLLSHLVALGEGDIALEMVRQLPPRMWRAPQLMAEVAQQLSFIGAHAQADAFARAAVDADPMHPPSLSMLATMDIFFGRLDDAAEHAGRCLERNPADPVAHWLISRLRRPAPGPRIDRIRAVLADCRNADDAVWLGFALHNELHEAGDFPSAWSALAEAGRTKRALLRYDAAQESALFDALMDWSPAEARASDGCEDTGLTPVFVTGLHRSGTTLAERVLSGHRAVRAGGETYEVSNALRRATGLHFRGELSLACVRARVDINYRELGGGYLRSMRWRAAGKPRVTDKLPSNYYTLGFVLRALPHARVIRVRRDPVDVGLSNLRTLFGEACPHSYDPLDFAAHFHRYERLMAHWHTLFPGRILDIDYRDLVDDPEGTARRMAAFCGLDYMPEMVDISSRSDAVSTASSVMMREGIRKDRSRVWKAYELQLQPMIHALGAG